MKFSGYDEQKVVWEVIDDHVVKDTEEIYDIGLTGIDLGFKNEYYRWEERQE